MNRINRFAASAAFITLAACSGGDEPPTMDEIVEAMDPIYSAPIDAITGQKCTHAGHSKYVCEFTVSAIGRFPEERSDCLFASASGWMVVDAYRCRN